MYEPRNYDNLLGMKGFSETLLKNHFTLYQGYVTNTNKVGETLTTWLKEGRTGPEYSELTRRYGWEWNGMRLHELYFENLGGNGTPPTTGKLATAINRDFGDFDTFRKAFTTAGTMRGIGWVVLTQDTTTGKLTITWIDEHNTGHLTGTTPVLVMDVFEHAFITDYGLKRADYVNAFWNNVDWDKATCRTN
jgi:Fe-Mn family superoxide dismutase